MGHYYANAECNFRAQSQAIIDLFAYPPTKFQANLLLCCFYKLLEQIPRRLLICQPFGVPLHGKSKRMVGEFDGFDQSVRRMARDAQRGCYVFESLMVVAVHF